MSLDFDAETADDLDVDMSAYYDANGGDKDAREMLEMRRMEMLRSGASAHLFDDRNLKSHKKLNSFHPMLVESAVENREATKSINPPEFGRKQLEKLGWKEGEPVGNPNRAGLKEPLDASDGKHPLDKSGLGYHGTKVDKAAMVEAQKRQREREHRSAPYFIGSKYDKDLDRSDSLLRRVEPAIKYRHGGKNKSANDEDDG